MPNVVAGGSGARGRRECRRRAACILRGLCARSTRLGSHRRFAESRSRSSSHRAFPPSGRRGSSLTGGWRLCFEEWCRSVLARDRAVPPRRRRDRCRSAGGVERFERLIRGNCHCREELHAVALSFLTERMMRSKSRAARSRGDICEMSGARIGGCSGLGGRRGGLQAASAPMLSL